MRTPKFVDERAILTSEQAEAQAQEFLDRANAAGTVSEPRTAPAAEKPCQLYGFHQPKPVRTQGHHRHPVALQNRVYGRIQDPELLWVDGACHDSLHSWINYLLGEWGEPNPHPGRNVKAEAQRTVDWYAAAMKEKA